MLLSIYHANKKKGKKDALLSSSFSHKNLEKLIKILDHFEAL